MKDYVARFYKMKIENSGELTEEKCEEINNFNKNAGLNFEIKSKDCKNNPGLRQIAKICLNSLWGKFGQRNNLNSYEFISNHNEFQRYMMDDKIRPKGFDIINEDLVEIRYQDN